jgi:parallel beta-helix repeat protein
VFFVEKNYQTTMNKRMRLKRGMKSWVVSLLLLSVNALSAATYYVDAIFGNDLFDGKTLATAKKTLQAAANLPLTGGDVVLVREGTYSNTGTNPVVSITKSGNASGWIVFKNYQNEKPVVEFDGWNGIEITSGASYIEINGFEVQGFRGVDLRTVAAAEAQYGTYSTCANLTINARFNGNGIVVKDNNNKVTTDNSHHIKIANCKVHDCGGGGIQVSGGDYITIEDNEVYRNAWYSVYANSGISFYQPYNSDITTGYKIVVQRNKSYNNDSKVKWQVGCKFSDGNGIIIDDFKNTQNTSSYGVYTAKTLVANNITFGNGGSGLHAFQSNNVDIVFNVSYQNGQRIANYNDGGIYANATSNVRILNNIIVGIAGRNVNSNFNNTSHTVNYNVFHQGNNPSVSGVNDLKATDPLFKNPSLNPAMADFRIGTLSPAANSGVSFPDVTTDIEGRPRSLTSVDRGPYKASGSVSVKDISDKTNTLKIEPSIAENNIKIVLNADKITPLSIVNIAGQQVMHTQGQGEYTVNISTLPAGLYIVRTENNQIGRFIKQ